jgi:hypothetical protein
MRRQYLLALISFVLLSCSPAPFNLNLSQSAVTASKLTFVGQVGPIQSLSSQNNSNFAFFPEKDSSGGITLQAGFVSWISQSTMQQIAFVAGGQVVGSPQNLGLITADPPMPGYIIQSVKSAHNNFVFSYDPATVSHFKWAQMTGNPSANTYTPPTWNDLNSLINTYFGIGLADCHIRDVSFSPNPNTGYDTAYVLVKDITNANQLLQTFLEAQFQISQNGLLVGTQLRGAEVGLNSLLPSDQAPFGPPYYTLYYYDPGTTYGFAEWYYTPSSSWICWKWTGIVAPSQVTGITHRIDALLTTGELFSSEGEVGRVYDQNGNQLSQFSLTDLSFVGEVYVGGVALMLFSQALWYNNALQFNVYSIPSSNVKSLGQ